VQGRRDDLRHLKRQKYFWGTLGEALQGVPYKLTLVLCGDITVVMVCNGIFFIEGLGWVMNI